MKGKLYVVTSIIPGNGAKYFSTNIGYFIKQIDKDNKKKVLLIDFDFDNPYLCYEYIKHDEFHGVDNVVNSINAMNFTQELFDDNVIKTKFGFDVIKGTTFNKKRQLFSKTIIETLLDFSLKSYDVVIAVIGNMPNDAGMVYSLNQADGLFLLGRNNNSNTLKAESVINTLKSFCTKELDLFFVHNYLNTESTTDLSSVVINSGFKVVGALKYDEKTIDNINLDKGDKGFNKSYNNNEFIKIVKTCILDELIVPDKKIRRGGK